MRDDQSQATQQLLASLHHELAAAAPRVPPEALVQDTLRRASQELREGTAVAPRWRAIPEGFERELARLLLAALPALALAIGWNAYVLARGPELLAAWLPLQLAWALPIAYAGGAAGWLALVLGSLPLLAHRRALMRLRETPG